MALKLSLKPGEKFVLNGAVVQNGDRRGVLILQNRASVLREKDIMQAEDVTTPARELRGSNDEIAAYLDALPVGSRVAQFAQDFRALSGAAWDYRVIDERTIELRLADAMEFLETVSYTRNWLSEMHERFCALSWPDWQALIASVGLQIDERSGPWRNEWLVEHRFAAAASLTDPAGTPLPWPDTHVLLVARRPLEG